MLAVVHRIGTTLLAVILSVVWHSFAASFFIFCKFDFLAIPVVVFVVVSIVLEQHFVLFDHFALVNQHFLVMLRGHIALQIHCLSPGSRQ
jgi:hypothetical protein